MLLAFIWRFSRKPSLVFISFSLYCPLADTIPCQALNHEHFQEYYLIHYSFWINIFVEWMDGCMIRILKIRRLTRKWSSPPDASLKYQPLHCSTASQRPAVFSGRCVTHLFVKETAGEFVRTEGWGREVLSPSFVLVIRASSFLLWFPLSFLLWSMGYLEMSCLTFKHLGSSTLLPVVKF